MSKSALPDFENRSVRKSQLRITKAGDGLSEALAMEPRAYHAGDEIYLVIRAKVTQINHKAEADTDDLVRVHTAEALDQTEVDKESVINFLADAHDRLQELRDKASGQERLDLAAAEKDGKVLVGAGLKVESDD